MAMIVAGRFTTFDQANLVASRLYDRAFRPAMSRSSFSIPRDSTPGFPSAAMSMRMPPRVPRAAARPRA